MTIASAVKVGKKLATGNFGYGQDDRKSCWRDNGKLGVAGLKEPGDGDCSFTTALIFYLGSLIPRSVLTGTIYSGNFGSALGKTGMVTRINVKKLTLAQIKAKAKTGDAIYGPGHVMFHLGGGKWLSFETTEKGKSTGGKLGRQKGEGVYVRSLYTRGASSRSKAKSKTGWTELVRAKSADVFIGQLFAAYSAGKSTSSAQQRLTLRAPWDGPRIAAFMSQWRAIDKGADLTFPGEALSVPQTNHAFVVLGSTASKMKRRLQVGLPFFVANPNSKILITGRPVREGVSEGKWMQQWLVQNGIDASRIILEEKASSTVGNALYSVPLLLSNKVTSYTLVSDASHLRRAQVEFWASLAKIEMIDNKRRTLDANGLLAYNDYGSNPIKPEKAVTAATRAAVAKEVATLFGVLAEYNAAL